MRLEEPLQVSKSIISLFFDFVFRFENNIKFCVFRYLYISISVRTSMFVISYGNHICICCFLFATVLLTYYSSLVIFVGGGPAGQPTFCTFFISSFFYLLHSFEH
jgi:hypothetical protein